MVKYYCNEENETEIAIEVKEGFDYSLEEIAERAAEKYYSMFAGEGFSDPNITEIIEVYNDKRELLGKCAVSVDYYPSFSARGIE